MTGLSLLSATIHTQIIYTDGTLVTYIIICLSVSVLIGTCYDVIPVSKTHLGRNEG